MTHARHPENDKVIPWPAKIDYTKQGVPVPGTKKPGQSAHYRNGIFGFLDESAPNILKTLPDIFENGLKHGRDRPLLGHRPIVSTNPLKFANQYVWQTYEEVDARRRSIGSAIHQLFETGKLSSQDFQTVGIWSANRPEWQIIDLACQAYNKVSVSLYDTLGKDAVEFIIQHAHIPIIFTTSDHIPALLKSKSQTPMLQMIISIDELTPEAKKILSAWASVEKVIIKDLTEFEATGRANMRDIIPAAPDQIASICYTSGTTNNPKGVLLRHKNLAMATQSNLFGLSLSLTDACLLSYLPLAHIYERVSEMATIAVAGRIGYFTGDPLRLLEDAQVLKPTFFPSVPRVLNRVYQSAMVAKSAGGLKGALFSKATQAKLDKYRASGDNTHAFWDRLVFSKIQAVLGGKLQLVSSGSAPISPDVMDFLKIAFACDVSEGYGMTETSATCTRSIPGDSTSSGTCGPPQPINELKLVDVPAMGYSSEDQPHPRGEVCIRGLNCFEVYYKDEKNTKETVDEEGWIHTGDVGQIDSCGRLKIIDRVKNIMKLSQGEYVALERVENLYSASPVVAQIYVHGDSLQSYLTAVVVPDPVQLAAAVQKTSGKVIEPTDQSALAIAILDEKVKAHILSILTKEAQRNGLKGFEMIKRIHLTNVLFSVENNTLTPTMKIRRKDAAKMYKKELEDLYALGEPSKL